MERKQPQTITWSAHVERGKNAAHSRYAVFAATPARLTVVQLPAPKRWTVSKRPCKGPQLNRYPVFTWGKP